MWVYPVEHGSVRNTEPPAMRVRIDCYTKNESFLLQ